MTSSVDARSSYFIAVGVETYRNFTDLKRVAEDVRLMQELFVEMGYELACPELASVCAGPSSIDIDVTLEHWIIEKNFTEDDTVAIYWAGHADVEGGQHLLLLPHTEVTGNGSRVITRTALPTRDLGGIVRSSDLTGKVMVLLDVCFAEDGTEQMMDEWATGVVIGRETKAESTKAIAALATALSGRQAASGVFAPALEDLVRGSTFALAGEWIHLSALVETLRTRIASTSPQKIGFQINDRGRDHNYFRNLSTRVAPVAGDDERDLEELREAHWRQVASGADEGEGVNADYFSGRQDLLDALTVRLDAHGSGMTVVTGLGGTGKSAVLARLRSVYEARIDASVRVTGMPLGDLTASLARQLGGGCGADDLAIRVRESGRLVLLVDALDEASQPLEIASWLRRICRISGVHVIVGTRPSDDIVTKLGSSPISFRDQDHVFDLEGKWFDPKALECYALRRLTHHGASPFRSDIEAARRRAGAVAKQAGTSFLLVRLVTRSLMEFPELPDDELPTTVKQALLGDIERRPNAEMFRQLLAVLSFTYEGLTPGSLWARIANAVFDAQYDAIDVEELCNQRGYYLTRDVGKTEVAGRNVLRLYHKSLADALRETVELDSVGLHTRIVDCLLASVPTDTKGRRNWVSDTMDPYALRRLGAHASACGRLDELLTEVGFLVAAEPSLLLPELRHANSIQGEAMVRAYRSVVHRLAAAEDLSTRAAYLELAWLGAP